MPLTVVVPDDLAAVAAETAERRGKSAEEVIVDTLRTHLRGISPELQQEFDMWERASDEDFAKFLREHGID